MKRVVLLLILALAACAAPIKMDPLAFKVDKGDFEAVPKVCNSAYEHHGNNVAVVNFTNNTSFDLADLVQGKGQALKGEKGVPDPAPASVAPVPVNQDASTSPSAPSQGERKTVGSRLSEAVEDGLTSELVGMGGSRVFTRKDMDKIITEQKFQQSGLVDDKQLVQLGKIAGVKYILTGSVNNVNLIWKEYGAKEMSRYGLAAAITSGAIGTQEGWNLTTDIAVRILDVETSEVLFSKVVTGKNIIGKGPYPDQESLASSIKKAAANALEDSRPELSKWFPVKGYIRQTRTSEDGSERSANVSIGEKNGLKPGQKLIVYAFEEMEDRDPVSGKNTVTCSMIKLPVELIVTEHVQAGNAWVLITGDSKGIKRVKKGMLVERMPLEGQGLFKKMGY